MVYLVKISLLNDFIIHHKPYLTCVGGNMEQDYFLYTMAPSYHG